MKKKLDVTASLVEGYDQDVPTQVNQAVDPFSLQSGGFSTTLNTSADFAWLGKRADLAGTAASNLRYYARLGETVSVGHTAGVGLTVRLPARTSVLFNEAAAYLPTPLYDLFPTGATAEPGSTPTSAPDYSASPYESYAYTSTIVVNHEITPRARLSAGGDFLYTDRLHETSQWRDVSSHAMRVDYSQHLRRNTALTMGYRYRKGEFGNAGDEQATEHGLDIGLSVTKPLSASRRESLDLGIGLSSLDVPPVGGSTEPGIVERQYLAVGRVGFGYDFGRTWQARANFQRGLEYVVDLPEPVFTNGVGASVAGLLTRRVDVSASAGYSSGESLLYRNSLSFDTYTTSLRVRYALSSSYAAYAQYLYYYYDFRGNAQLAAGIPPGLDRNGVRAGLTLWLPALRR